MGQGIIELGGNAQEALWGSGPGDDRHFDFEFAEEAFLQRVEVERAFGRFEGGGIRNRE